jgi:sulfatase modifying factor 1
VYAWGDVGPGTSPVYAIYDCYYPPTPSDFPYCTGLADIAPVGSAPLGVGRWGQLDLTGNVYEWMLDYSAATLPASCPDCAATTGGTERIFRGGSYVSSASELVTSPGVRTSPLNSGGDGGLRCARAP